MHNTDRKLRRMRPTFRNRAGGQEAAPDTADESAPAAAGNDDSDLADPVLTRSQFAEVWLWSDDVVTTTGYTHLQHADDITACSVSHR